MNSYTLKEDLLQAMVNVLNDLPARQTRQLLNAIEATCAQQDMERQAGQAEALKQAHLAEAQAATDATAGRAGGGPAAPRARRAGETR